MNFFALSNNGCWFSSCFQTFQRIFPYEFKFDFKGFDYMYYWCLYCLDPFGCERRAENSFKNTQYAIRITRPFFILCIHVYCIYSGFVECMFTRAQCKFTPNHLLCISSMMLTLCFIFHVLYRYLFVPQLIYNDSYRSSTIPRKCCLYNLWD